MQWLAHSVDKLLAFILESLELVSPGLPDFSILLEKAGKLFSLLSL